MLRRYRENINDVVFYEYRKNNQDYEYIVTFDHVVYKRKKNSSDLELVPVYRLGEDLFVYIGRKAIRLANIVNFAFKGNNPKYRNELLYLDITFIDGDHTNLHPANLIWNNTNLQDDKEGFRTIPGFSRYKINREGVVIDKETGEEKKWAILSNIKFPYPKVNIRSDAPFITREGKLNYSFSPPVHRLVAMAFLPIPSNFFKMDVSHLDCDCTNPKLENLEWSSRSKNNLQTVYQDKSKCSKSVLVRNVRTNEVTEYPSASECTRQLGLRKMVTEYRCNSKGKTVFSDYTQFCYKKDFTSWGKIDLERDLLKSGVRQKVKCIDVKRDKIYNFNSIAEASRFTQVKDYTISHHFNKHNTNVFEYNHYIFYRYY